jgi:hypothetical protein
VDSGHKETCMPNCGLLGGGELYVEVWVVVMGISGVVG